MSVIITMPERIETQLGATWHDLPRKALEAVAIEAYREELLSAGQVAEVLGLSVIETERFLKEKNVDLLYTLQDLEHDRAALHHIISR